MAVATRRNPWRAVRRIAIFVGAIGAFAAVLAALLFQRPELFLIGAFLLFAYSLFLLAPVILADATKEAQDEAVQDTMPRRLRPRTSQRDDVERIYKEISL